MEATDFMIWRHKHKISKSDLAKALGVHRHSVARWEAGETRPPKGIVQRLHLLAMAKEEQETPKILTHVTAEAYSGLKLYGTVMTVANGRVWYQDEEHPCNLLGLPTPAPFLAPTTDEYKTALMIHREKANKRMGELPTRKLSDEIAAAQPSGRFGDEE